MTDPRRAPGAADDSMRATPYSSSGPAPSTVRMVARQGDYWWTSYRRTWRGSVVTAFLEPLFYVVAMGVLLGEYVDGASGTNAALGVRYLDFVAPGLLAATAMQFAGTEAMWPVMGALKWDRTYYSMIATPLRVSDIVAGHLASLAIRTLVVCAVFVLVMAPFGVFATWGGALLTIVLAQVTAIAIAAAIYAVSVRVRNEANFAMLYRLVVFPMFLFSGAFFPVSNLPDGLEWLARLLPLWHGVELCRMASLDAWAPAGTVLGHLAYLLALLVGAVWLGVRGLQQRLVV
jgi:lipooligosaccharide transport system permease protein